MFAVQNNLFENCIKTHPKLISRSFYYLNNKFLTNCKCTIISATIFKHMIDYATIVEFKCKTLVQKYVLKNT